MFAQKRAIRPEEHHRAVEGAPFRSTTPTASTRPFSAAIEPSRSVAGPGTSTALASSVGTARGLELSERRDFLDFATRSTEACRGPAEYAYEYLLVVARKGGR